MLSAQLKSREMGERQTQRERERVKVREREREKSLESRV
jgi:hypothetical protein